MYTHIRRSSEGASGHTLGVLGAKRWGAGRNPPVLCLRVSSANGPSLLTPSLPLGIYCHQGLELKQETRFGLKKKEAGGGFFLPFFYTIL